MKISALFFAAAFAVEESLLSGKNMIDCPITAGAESCIKAGRTDGTLVCAELTQAVKDAMGGGMSGYATGYNCMCTGMWKYATNQGHTLNIIGEASHNCATHYVGTGTSWNLSDYITDLSGEALSTMCTK